MHTPQIVYIILTTLGLGISMAQHGQERTPENFWKTLLAVVVGYSVLIWGGFFTN